MPSAPPRHFLQLRDFAREEFDHLFARTRWIKERFKRYEIYQPLRDRTLAMRRRRRARACRSRPG
jgi:ornithine carbamoyltransferase